jgi:hypothetical protein
MTKKRKQNNHIPGHVKISALKKMVLKQPEHEERYIREYVELEATGENVTHLEKLTTESVLNRQYDVWDVRTNKDRYWVITNPTNLYSQKLSPSMDYTLSFHIGVTMRVSARQARTAPEQKSRLSQSAWRLWEQAAEALEKADDAEKFQTVGMICRECLIAFSKSIALSKIVSIENAPKSSDFIGWSQIYSNIIAKGQSSKETRNYLKTLSKSTWQLINWLTHSSSVVWFDGNMAVDAVYLLLSTFDIALIRFEEGTPNRCPKCLSYKIISDYRADLDEYVTLCEACGWTDYNPDSRLT